jgi:hypothetical protein
MHLLLTWEVISVSQPAKLKRPGLRFINDLNGWNKNVYSSLCTVHMQRIYAHYEILYRRKKYMYVVADIFSYFRTLLKIYINSYTLVGGRTRSFFSLGFSCSFVVSDFLGTASVSSVVTCIIVT